MMRALKFTALRILITLACLVLWALLAYRPIQISVSPSPIAAPMSSPPIQVLTPIAPPPTSVPASASPTGEYLKGADSPTSGSASAVSAPPVAATPVDAEVERIEKALERIKEDPIARETFFTELNDLTNRVREGVKIPQKLVLDPGNAPVGSEPESSVIRNSLQRTAGIEGYWDKGGPKQ